MIEEFLAAALGGVRVLGREPLGAGVGLQGQLVRLQLDGAPGTMLLKLPPAAEANRAIGAMFDLYRREASFYRDLGEVVDVRIPRCHAVRLAGDADTALLLEDLGGLLTVSQIDGAGLGHARRAMDAAASLHAWGWQRPELAALPWLVPMNSGPWAALGPAYRQSVPVFLDRLGEQLPPGSAAACALIGDRFEALSAAAARVAPLTLCHGDFRLDNLLFPTDPAERTAVVDWQVVMLGPGVMDLAMFLTQSLEPQLRRDHEHELIAHWRDELTTRRPSHAYPLADAVADYRLLTMFATVVPVVAGATYDWGNDRGRTLAKLMARRAFTAVLELEALEVLP